MSFQETKSDFYPRDDLHNFYPYICHTGNEKIINNSHNDRTLYGASDMLNLEKSHKNNDINYINKMYNKTQLYYPHDRTIQNDATDVFSNSFYETKEHLNKHITVSNGNSRDKKIFRKNACTHSCNRYYNCPVDIGDSDNMNCVHNKNNKGKSKIKLKCLCDDYDDDDYNDSGESDDYDRVSRNKDYSSCYENSHKYTSKKEGRNKTVIHITTDHNLSEDDCTMYNDENILNSKKKKKKRPRKKFMGKYLFSEIKNCFRSPWNVNDKSRPFLTRPSLKCFHYLITEKEKEHRGRKPEIFVRF
ncbi:conserved Plasmodium protein, unknown function [Plasmodium malariae]|uniref:Uncharacterized protein n=1 Tax=Plasmodium malariae TaxID=5858 RepID=A0A1C3L195_PLAMA|nr:conserved Plasmodium protein, unknown function [Plasmodium malariae]